MRKQALAFAACLALVGCGTDKNVDDIVNTGELSVAAGGKADSIGGRRYETFGGVLAYGGAPRVAQIQDYGYRVAYTFRAKARQEFKVSASGTDFSNLDTVIALYGPKGRNGNYPFVAYSDDSGGQLSSVIKHKPRADGIYLLLVTAYEGGSADVGLSCGSPTGCDLPCAVNRLYKPVCGADGQTYGNPQAAACNDVPVAHDGTCEPSCDSISCGEGEHCELQEVQCIRAPCYPQPACVPDETGPTCANVRCAAGTHCELVDVVCVRAPCPPQPECVQDITACATVRCTSSTHCVDHGDGTASCEPNTNPCAAVLCAPNTTCEVDVDGNAACKPITSGGCLRTGCSGQICSDQNVITTCVFNADYACYQNAACERQANGGCGFTSTPELTACLDAN